MDKLIKSLIKVDDFSLTEFKENKNNDLNFNKYYILDFDESGEYFQDEFLHEISQYITDYVFTHDEIKKYSSGKTRKEMRRYEEKYREIIQLYVRDSRTGEIGELILFLILEKFLQAPQLVNYMTTSKLSGKEYSKGFDNIHFGLINDNLVFYIGESKSYKNGTKGLRDAFKSIKEILDERQVENFRYIAQNNIFKREIHNKEFENLIVKYFNPNRKAKDRKLAKEIYTIFVAFEFDKIEEIIQNGKLQEEYEKRIKNIEKNLKNYKEEFDLVGKNFVLIILPIKKIQKLRDDFVKLLGCGKC